MRRPPAAAALRCSQHSAAAELACGFAARSDSPRRNPECCCAARRRIRGPGKSKAHRGIAKTGAIADRLFAFDFDLRFPFEAAEKRSVLRGCRRGLFEAPKGPSSAAASAREHRRAVLVSDRRSDTSTGIVGVVSFGYFSCRYKKSTSPTGERVKDRKPNTLNSRLRGNDD